MNQPTAIWSDFPADFRAIGTAFVDGLVTLLGERLYGIYLYGAAVFNDGSLAQDFDCHVILTDPLTEDERQAVEGLHVHLAEVFPPLGGELDAYYILLADACRPDIPQHQVWSHIEDRSWALHCAHVRAGRYLTLYGPEPDDLFPAPTWDALAAALDHELAFVRANLRYPAYCVLNLCRIIYSFQTRDVVVSKRFSGRWAREAFPQWARLIAAAERAYAFPGDERLTADLDAADVGRFLIFAEARIDQARRTDSTSS